MTLMTAMIMIMNIPPLPCRGECWMRSNTTATNFLAPLSLLILTLIYYQRWSKPKQLNSIYSDFDLNKPYAKKTSVAIGMEAFYRAYRSSKYTSVIKNSSKLQLILSLLLISGNVELNPGPQYKFPCGSCDKPVKKNQEGIQCDLCDIWYHTRCIQMCLVEYEALGHSSCTWICSRCGNPNFSNSLLDPQLDFEHPNHFSPLNLLKTSSQFNNGSLHNTALSQFANANESLLGDSTTQFTKFTNGGMHAKASLHKSMHGNHAANQCINTSLYDKASSQFINESLPSMNSSFSPGPPVHASSPSMLGNLTSNTRDMSKLSILNVNCQSVLAKNLPLAELADSVSPDIIVALNLGCQTSTVAMN